MSRIGKLPVTVPEKVKVDINGQEIVVKGAKGELKASIDSNANISFTDGHVHVAPANDTKNARAMWGTARALIQNMVKGVNEGFTVRIDIVGVGFRAAVDKGMLTMSLGYSHE